ncbi:uncharacterized protein LOC134257069 [Saccostrea cucullata]|uniref:uncharacterized protein LOC134257069 n=1 Tax=Saccostrea cuccullata TaxID=36930 RepID=UPI002ED2D209
MEESRFGILSEEQLQSIINNKVCLNTKAVVKTATKILKTYLNERDLGDIDDLVNVSSEQLNLCLRKFYAELRKVDGTKYARKSMVTIRNGLQQHFIKTRSEDIISEDRFNTSSALFKAVLVQLKKAGVGETKSKEPIVIEDMEKLYESAAFSVDTSEGLQNKTLFEYLYYFCNRGRENLREVQKSDFCIAVDPSKREYVSVINKQTKNHRGYDIHNKDHKQSRMYDRPGDSRCPVASFKKYLSKLHSSNPNFWQRPKRKYSDDEDTWYENSALGKNTLYSIMSRVSEDYTLSKRYTNYCVRATSITVLDHKGVEARHIIGVSGHKSETYIKLYSSHLSEDKKRQMSDILSDNVPPPPPPAKRSARCEQFEPLR